MSKIFIVEEKADKIVENLEWMKEAVCEMLEYVSESMEGHREYDDEEDDEYEVRHRRGSRRGTRRGMRRGGSTSRF